MLPVSCKPQMRDLLRRMHAKLNFTRFARMKNLALIIALLHISLSFGQTAFERSEAAFDKYLMTDSTKTKAELEFQRTHARTSSEKARYLLNQAEYYSYTTRHEEAQALLEKVRTHIGKNNVDLAARRIYLLARLNYRMNRFRESNEMIRKFLHTHEQVPTEWKIRLETTSSENDISLGEFERAHRTALDSYGTFRHKPSAVSDKVKLKVLATLYNTCYYQAKYDSALYYAYLQEPFIEEGTIAQSAFYDKLAIVYTVTERPEKAIAYYKKSIAILEKANNPMLLAYSWLNMGICYKEVDRSKAIPSLETALRLGRETKHDQLIGTALQELGDVYVIQKDYARAEKYNYEALEILRKVGVDRGIANVLLNLGRSCFETGKFDEAQQYLGEALGMMEKSGDQMMLEYCYEYLYKSYEHIGDYRMAHRYHKLYAKTRQQNLRADLQNNIDKLNLSHEVRMEQANNKLLKEELAAGTKIKWLLGSLVGVLLIGAWFLRRLLVQRTRLKELQLQLVQSELKGVEQEKERTVQELDSVKQQLISKNMLVGELNKLLVENEQTLISNEQLSKLATNDADWVQFLAKLQVLFPQFADNLKSRHPNLSNTEFRLAALIRLNLSDKEISELLFIELSSVKKSKNRLKQKLGLETSDKLDAYLGQL